MNSSRGEFETESGITAMLTGSIDLDEQKVQFQSLK